MRKKKRSVARTILNTFLILFILSGLGAGAYRYYINSQIITVKTTSVKRGLFLYTVTSTSSGTLKADHVARISSRTNGRVVRVNFKEGGRVGKGQELVALDSEESRAVANMAEANLSLARVKYERAKAAFELEKKLIKSRVHEMEAKLKEASSALRRAKEMLSKGIYSDQQLDLATRNFDVAKAAHDSAIANREGIVLKEKEMLAAKAEAEQLKEALNVTRIQITYLKITAPFDGIISYKDVEIGEMVLPGEHLADVVDDRSIYIDAPIDEADIYKLLVGQNVNIAIDAFPLDKFTGKIYEISPIVSEEKNEGRTVAVKISIDPCDVVLRTGMSCDIEILIKKIPDVLLLPTNLIMGRGDKKYAFVVRDGFVKKSHVSPGLSNWDETVVKGGIGEGEEVISSIDILNLKEGSRVVVKNE